MHLDDVYFEDTLAAKVDRLASLDLDVFIDDLADVFEQPHFPQRHPLDPVRRHGCTATQPLSIGRELG